MKENRLHYFLFVATAGTITTLYCCRNHIYSYIIWHPLQGHSRYIYFKNLFKSEGGYQGIITNQFRDLFLSFLTEKRLIFASPESIEILCHLVQEIKEYPFYDIKWSCLMNKMMDSFQQGHVNDNSHVWKLAIYMLEWDFKNIFDMKDTEKEEETINYQSLYNVCYQDCFALWQNGRSLRLEFSLKCLTHFYFYKLLLIPIKQNPFPEEMIQELQRMYPIDDFDSKDNLYFRMNHV